MWTVGRISGVRLFVGCRTPCDQMGYPGLEVLAYNFLELFLRANSCIHALSVQLRCVLLVEADDSLNGYKSKNKRGK